MTAPSVARNRSGKIKVATLIWLSIIGSLLYCSIEIGGVYLRKFKLSEVITQELSFAGQRSDESIRQRVLDDIAGLGLPPAATRGLQFARTGRPQALQVSISYSETVNLVFTEKQIPVSVRVRRIF